jgi:hypothetical protein
MPDARLDRALSVRQLARRWAISPRKIRDLIRRRLIRAIDVGTGRRQLRILPEAIAEAEQRLSVQPRQARRPRRSEIDPAIVALLEDSK